MKEERIYDVIRSTIITEKSTRALETENRHSFIVSKDATKHNVKHAVEKIFNVNVTKVNIINIAGKIKRFKGVIGKRNNYKKAIVSLSVGQMIDISGMEV